MLLGKYWFTIVLYFFLYWKSIGLTLFYVAFCVGKDCFLIGIILVRIGLILFYISFCIGKVLVLYVFKLFFVLE